MTHNLSLLDKSYDPIADRTESIIPADVLIAIWAELTLEYSELMDTGTLKDILNRKLEIDLMQLKVDLATRCVDILKEAYIPEIVTELTKMGFEYALDPDQELSYFKDLSSILKRVKQIRIQIKVKENDLVKYAKPTENTKEKSLDDWEAEKIMLEDDSKMEIDWDKKSVFHFAQRYKNMIARIKMQRAQLNAIPKKK